MALQRPLTRKEFVIQSLLEMREPWATLVDPVEIDDQDPTMPMPRARRDTEDELEPSSVMIVDR
jgi:hypothetical protein